MPMNKDISVLGGLEHDLAKTLPVASSPGTGIPAMESAVLRAESAAEESQRVSEESLDIANSALAHTSLILLDTDGRPYLNTP